MADRRTNSNPGNHGDATTKHDGSILDVLNRLKAYEDTGLSPEQVNEMRIAWDMYGGEEGITAAFSHMREWISVRDRLPEMSRGSNGTESDVVLIYDWVTHERALAYLTNSGVWKDPASYSTEYDVSHWMHLPETPKSA